MAACDMVQLFLLIGTIFFVLCCCELVNAVHHSGSARYCIYSNTKFHIVYPIVLVKIMSLLQWDELIHVDMFNAFLSLSSKHKHFSITNVLQLTRGYSPHNSFHSHEKTRHVPQLSWCTACCVYSDTGSVYVVLTAAIMAVMVTYRWSSV